MGFKIQTGTGNVTYEKLLTNLEGKGDPSRYHSCVIQQVAIILITENTPNLKKRTSWLLVTTMTVKIYQILDPCAGNKTKTQIRAPYRSLSICQAEVKVLRLYEALGVVLNSTQTRYV